MRSLLATRIFAPEAAAGAFRLTALVRALAERGVVDVVTVRASGTYRPPAGVRVSRWPVLRDASGYVRGYLPYLSFDVPLVLRLLLARRPDVVVVEPPPTTGLVVRVVAALRRIPYVWYAADIWSDATASTGAPVVVTRVVRAIERWVLRGAALVLSVSDGVTERVTDLGAERVVTVGNGVDTDVFSPDGEELAGPLTFVYAGTASEWQGADIFARAMPLVREQVPDARLVYLGQGSAWTAIGTIAARLPEGAVTMLGNVPPARSAAWLRGATAAVVSIVPGQGYDFAVPTKLFAALGTGTPVLYAGVGPVVDLVTGEDLGWAVPYDVDAVARAMVAALAAGADDGSGARARRATWAREHRSLTAVADRAAEAIREVVSDAAGRRRRRSTR